MLSPGCELPFKWRHLAAFLLLFGQLAQGNWIGHSVAHKFAGGRQVRLPPPPPPPPPLLWPLAFVHLSAGS